MKFTAAVFGSVGLLIQGPMAAANDVKAERVQFERGKSGTTISGAIKGYDTMHYLLGAQAGQTMEVNLETKSTSTNFAPGKMPGRDEAMFIGDTGGGRFETVLPETGNYLIQVYLCRSAARRNGSAKFTLDVAIAAASGSEGANTGDATVPGTDFNATGNIPCARSADQPMVSCKFGIVREGSGNGYVTAFRFDGGTRVICFEAGTPTTYDRSQLDAGAEMSVDHDAGPFMVKIGNERFDIPDAVISGG